MFGRPTVVAVAGCVEVEAALEEELLPEVDGRGAVVGAVVVSEIVVVDAPVVVVSQPPGAVWHGQCG